MTTWNEFRIARAIGRQTLASKCVLLVDNCSWTGHECDVLGVTTDLRLVDVEIKISRADLKADAKKDKWWIRKFAGYDTEQQVMTSGRVVAIQRKPKYDETKREWPPKVWKHYYALPKDLWMDTLFEALPSPRSGVLLVTENRSGSTLNVECVRRSTPNKDASLITPAQVMDIARLANLRMWDAYESRHRAHLNAEKAGSDDGEGL